MVMLARESQRCLITRLQQVLPLFACSPPCRNLSLQQALVFFCAHTHSTLDKMSSSSDVSTLMSMFSNLGRQEIEQEYRCHLPTAPCGLRYLVPGHQAAISKRPSSSSPNLATWSATHAAACVLHPWNLGMRATVVFKHQETGPNFQGSQSSEFRREITSSPPLLS